MRFVLGDVVGVGPDCGAQFRATGPFLFRIVKIWRYAHTPEWAVYLAGWRVEKIDGKFKPVEERPMLYVEHAGLTMVHRSQLQSRPGAR